MPSFLSLSTPNPSTWTDPDTHASRQLTRTVLPQGSCDAPMSLVRPWPRISSPSNVPSTLLLAASRQHTLIYRRHPNRPSFPYR
jgi:hypothetical protein